MVVTKEILFWTYSILACFVGPVASHGRLMDPPARNSMWRFGFGNPVNYNDNELYCGGKMVQWVRNGGKCGVCGDPWHGSRPHEAGGKYANNIISRTYRQGALVNMAVHLTANHEGWFEFRLCPVSARNRKVDQQCLDKYVLQGADGKTTRFQITRGKYNSFFNFTLKLPKELVCDQCVLQWKYKTGNTWDKDVKSGLYCLGCGPQEEFYNCADVSIKPKSKTKQTTTKKRFNSKRVSELVTNAPNVVEQSKHRRSNMAATTMAPMQRYTERQALKRVWRKKSSQSQLNRIRPSWFLAANNNVNNNNNRGHVTKPSRNVKHRNSTTKTKWMTSRNNFMTHSKHIAATTKNRGDSPLDNIYIKSKGRQVTQKRKNGGTNLLGIKMNVNNNNRGHVTKPSRNVKHRNSTTKTKWMTSRNNFMTHSKHIAATTKNRGDSPLDNIYIKSKGRQVTQKRKNGGTNLLGIKMSNPSTTKSIWRWWAHKTFSPTKDSNSNQQTGNRLSNSQPELVSSQRTTTSRSSDITTVIKTTISLCHSKKRMHQNKSKAVISPVRSYNSGGWRQQLLQSSAKPFTPAWTLKPVLKCRSLISLSGGMDSWCFANCNANYCPPDICSCERDLSYVPLYTGHALLGENGNNLNRPRPSPQRARPPKDPLRIRSGGTSRRNTMFPSVGRHYGRSETAKTLICRAIGLYSRRPHFDEWCNQNCIRNMCPAFICRCTRQHG